MCLFNFFLIGIMLLSSNIAWAQEKVPEISTEGATFFVNKGGDLGKLLERKHPDNAEGRFSIEIHQLPKKKAKIAINAYDLDEERGETNTIFFNGHELGKLSGTDNSWNTSVFDLEMGWIKKGKNDVLFIIGDSSKTGTINWSGKVGWAQVLIDGGAGDAGTIGDLALVISDQNKAVSTASINIKKDGEFKLETTIFDLKGNAIESKLDEFSSSTDNKKVVIQRLPFDTKQPSGNYKVVSNLFFKKENFWMQQVSKELSIQFLSHAAKIVDGKTMDVIRLNEDTPATTVDLNGLFMLEGVSPEEAKKRIITKKIISVDQPEILDAKLLDNILTVIPKKNKNGKVVILIEGKQDHLKVQKQLFIEITPVDDPPYIKDPQADITVSKGAKPIVINLKKIFSDIDSPDEKITFTHSLESDSVLGNVHKSQTELIQLSENQGNLTIGFSDKETGSNTIQVTADSNGKTVTSRFNVTINSPDSIQVKTAIDPITMDEDGKPVTISLKDLFEDLNVKSGHILKVVHQVDNPKILNADILGDDLILTPFPDQHGDASVIIKGTSRGSSIDSSVKVTIIPIDDAPVVNQKLPKLILNKAQPTKELNLSQLFTDIDNNDSNIELSISVEKNDKIIHDLQGDTLTIQSKESRVGFVKTTITGTSNGKSAEYELPVYVDFGNTFKFSVYGVYGIETVKNYSDGQSYGIGAGITLNQHVPGLKAEVEYLYSSGHSRSDSKSGVGYTSDLSISIIAAYIGYNFKIPDAWLSPDSIFTKVELTAKIGQAFVHQKISSTPDDSNAASANDTVSTTNTVSTSSFGAGYYFSEQWVCTVEQLYFGSDIRITRAGIRYNF